MVKYGCRRASSALIRCDGSNLRSFSSKSIAAIESQRSASLSLKMQIDTYLVGVLSDTNAEREL